MNPMFLPGNQLEHFYLGGSSIAAFRGLEKVPTRMPEDWVGSTTTRFGEDHLGLSTLPDGRRLFDAISADPIGWLGADHHRVFGSSTELLVKLLDAGQRLLVHCHRDRSFAREHLGCAHGKTEAWIVLDTPGPDPVVYLGFQEEVTHDELEGWVRHRRRSRRASRSGLPARAHRRRPFGLRCRLTTVSQSDRSERTRSSDKLFMQ
jgi:mannose-6-phosphate isomerase